MLYRTRQNSLGFLLASSSLSSALRISFQTHRQLFFGIISSSSANRARRMKQIRGVRTCSFSLAGLLRSLLSRKPPRNDGYGHAGAPFIMLCPPPKANPFIRTWLSWSSSWRRIYSIPCTHQSHPRQHWFQVLCLLQMVLIISLSLIAQELPLAGCSLLFPALQRGGPWIISLPP